MSLPYQLSLGIALLSLGIIIGYYIGSQNISRYQAALMEAQKQIRLTEQSKTEAGRQEFYAMLSKKKTEKDSSQNASIINSRTTIYKVGDIDKAKKWYAEAFKSTPYFEKSKNVYFNIGGSELWLQAEENTTKKTETTVSYWSVKNIENEYNRFIQLGATENEKPQNINSVIFTASVKDPWGNVIGLIYNPKFLME